MKKQVNFEDAVEAYRFEVSKSTLAFNADSFYKCFFKGLDEKPLYELIKPPSDLDIKAKHVFATVEAIFKKTCDSIDEKWFAPVGEHDEDKPVPVENIKL
ncbi:hypothetical protein [Raoultibacter phocaeensis]|uniref:hypothetical protein n=1 Tax=Raoultibacter phocaeensis TaxID=2479841 RepID=UPI001119997F|nr:hypothetical protein [Raoultibacter phocaeensis]